MPPAYAGAAPCLLSCACLRPAPPRLPRRHLVPRPGPGAGAARGRRQPRAAGGLLGCVPERAAACVGAVAQGRTSAHATPSALAGWSHQTRPADPCARPPACPQWTATAWRWRWTGGAGWRRPCGGQCCGHRGWRTWAACGWQICTEGPTPFTAATLDAPVLRGLLGCHPSPAEPGGAGRAGRQRKPAAGKPVLNLAGCDCCCCCNFDL